MSETIGTALRILRRRQLESRTGLGRSAIYDRLNPGSPRFDPTFPKPINLGSTTSVGWVEHEVDQWIAAQIARRQHEPPTPRGSSFGAERPNGLATPLDLLEIARTGSRAQRRYAERLIRRQGQNRKAAGGD